MKFYIVDCFAEEKYQGNELLVIKADRHVSDEEQQKIAREINFSETAFILSDKKDDGGYDVRIVEFFNSHHPDLNDPDVSEQMNEQFPEGMFRFEKVMKS